MILASNEATARACKWLGRHSVSLSYLSLSAEFTIGGFSISAKEKTKSGKQGKHTKNYGKIHHFQWENHGKSTISMAMFNSYISHYQRVNLEKKTISPAILEVVRFGDNTGQNFIENAPAKFFEFDQHTWPFGRVNHQGSVSCNTTKYRFMVNHLMLLPSLTHAELDQPRKRFSLR